jgi:trigger factor
MQVTQTLNEGLKRGYKVVLPASDLERRLSGELENYRGKVKINGFRPGKVPAAHLRKVYGRSIMAEVVQNAVEEANNKIVADGGFKLAMQPKITLPEDKATIDKVMEAKADLDVTVEIEVLPKFDIADHSGITLEREVSDVADADVTARIEELAAGQVPYTEKTGKSVKAESGDRLSIDFVGTMGGVAFDGGSGEGIQLVIGSNAFIPGFEEQLIGAQIDKPLTVNVTFPLNYSAAQLAGKDASFAVTVKSIEVPGKLEINDELAKSFGMEGLDKLKERVKEMLEAEYSGHSRRKLKRQLLDALDGQYAFELPPTLLEQEFTNIWRQVEVEMKQNGKTFEDEGSTEAESRAEYQKIAERRVRLGLVLAEIGEKAEVQISDDEVGQALISRARQFPGQEKQVIEFYRKNQQALAELRAPIFEDKVVDHLIGQVTVKDKKVSKDDLLKDEDDEEVAEKPKAKAKKASKKDT